MEAVALEVSQCELKRGKPTPSVNHSIVQLNLGFELKTRYREQFRFVSEINIEVAGRVMIPDLGIFPKTVAYLSTDSIVAPQSPLTPVEILSPSQSIGELISKAAVYFAAGVQSCWIVVPEVKGVFLYSTPEEYQFFHAAQMLTDATTGIELPLSPLFE